MKHPPRHPGPRSRTVPFVLAALLVGALGLTGCQSTMSLEDAKKVTASFSHVPLTPPPRRIDDVLTLLDRAGEEHEQMRGARAQIAKPPPPGATPAVLADFHRTRARAFRAIGQVKPAFDELEIALTHSRKAGGHHDYRILSSLGGVHFASGRLALASENLQAAIDATPYDDRGWLFFSYSNLSRILARVGELDRAQQLVSRLEALHSESYGWRASSISPADRAEWEYQMVRAQANLALTVGDFERAESLFRRAIRTIARAQPATVSWESYYRAYLYDDAHWALATTFRTVGRHAEAEATVRMAIQSAVARTGAHSRETIEGMEVLGNVLFSQGRFDDSERVARAGLEILDALGTTSDAYRLHIYRAQLGRTLVARNRWADALREFERINPDDASRPIFQGYVSWGLALLKNGRIDAARAYFEQAIRRFAPMLGDRHELVGLMRGGLAMAHHASGDLDLARAEFTRAMPAIGPDANPLDRGERDRGQEVYRRAVLRGYLEFLDAIQRLRRPGAGTADEAFRVAEILRGQSVQRAVNDATARAAIPDPRLAALVREEQDTRNRLHALARVLLNAATQDAATEPGTIDRLRRQIDDLRRAHQEIEARITAGFPAYADLIAPAIPGIEKVRNALRPGESLVAFHVAPERTYAWAIPKSGPAAFVVLPVTERWLGAAVTRLRAALAPKVRTVGEIPGFDLQVAHELYASLLEPLKHGWENADTIIVMPDGPLGHIPFGLLPTRSVALGAERGPLFSSYRAVPWLVRTHAVVGVPSATALLALGSARPAETERRPFIGFGDPYFTEAHARSAARRGPTGGPPALATATPTQAPAETVVARSLPLTLREVAASPGAEVKESRLAMLPRLPDTAEEILGIAEVTGSDPARDVFLGTAATEATVKRLDLSRYRLIAFATHGLVPGDVDGLTQPALALTAPELSGTAGDGLLTMEEILVLRLDADWVVLSACNTANGAGDGAEAISGLGRAFFYAGARALLVSHWPVETTSARALTTGLFKRYATESGLSRAKALQHTMNGLIDDGARTDSTGKAVFSYAHPMFWAPFALIGDGG